MAETALPSHPFAIGINTASDMVVGSAGGLTVLDGSSMLSHPLDALSRATPPYEATFERMPAIRTGAADNVATKVSCKLREC